MMKTFKTCNKLPSLRYSWDNVFKKQRIQGQKNLTKDVLSAKKQLTDKTQQTVCAIAKSLHTSHADAHAHSAFSKNLFTKPTASPQRQR